MNRNGYWKLNIGGKKNEGLNLYLGDSIIKSGF